MNNRVRPLLVSFASEANKLSVISSAPRLLFHKNYKKVYIAPDMTKLERAKHKKLVDELKRRRQQGELNLVIKNGIIVQRQLVQSTSTTVNVATPTSLQTSSSPMVTDGDSQNS